MGRFDVNNEEKAPSDAKKRGKGLVRGDTLWSEAFSGTSKALNALQVKFDYGEGNDWGRFSECLRLTTAYLSTKLKGGGNVETSIWNGKVFDSACPDPVGPNPAATNDKLQAEYGTRAIPVARGAQQRPEFWERGHRL